MNFDFMAFVWVYQPISTQQRSGEMWGKLKSVYMASVLLQL